MNNRNSLLGALIGDVCGSSIEGALVSSDPYPQTRIIGNKFNNPRADRTGEIVATMPLIVKGCRPTDDTALSCAVAAYVMGKGDIIDLLQEWALYPEFPDFDFGKQFLEWAKSGSRKSQNV